MIKFLIFLFFLVIAHLSIAQSISGRFTHLANQTIKLKNVIGLKIRFAAGAVSYNM
jgi:hypothetical protein